MQDNNTPQPSSEPPDNSRDNEAIHPTPSDLPNVNHSIPESQQPIPQQDIITSPGSVPTGLPPNIHGPEQPKSSKSHIKRLLSKKSLTWLSISLIVGPILGLILLGMAFSGPDGGLVVVALGAYLLFPMALGLLLCIVLVSLFLLRKPKDAKKHPVKKALAAVFVILTLALLSTATYAFVHARIQQKKYDHFFTLNQQQAVQLIGSCKISYLSQDGGGQEEIDFNNKDKAATAASNASGIDFYTSTSNWNTLVNAANSASKKCGFIEADNLNPTFTWISQNTAEQLLLSCKVYYTEAYYDGVYQYDGATVSPGGRSTGTAVLDMGNSDTLYMTDNTSLLLKDTVNYAQHKCGIEGINNIYTQR